MTATATSVAAYQTEEESGRLTGIRMRVLRALREHGPSTARELAEASGLNPTIQKRLNELEKAGAAEVVGERPCRVSGKSAKVWRAKNSQRGEGAYSPALSMRPTPPGPSEAKHGASSIRAVEFERGPLITYERDERGEQHIISQRHTTSSRRPGADIHGSVKVLPLGSVQVELAAICACGTVNPCSTGQHCQAFGHARCGCEVES